MFNTEFLDFLQKSWGLYGVIIFAFIAFIIYLPKFIDSVTYFKSRKIQHINEALESEYVDDDSKRLLSENITRIYLARSLGVRTSGRKVQETLKIYDILQGEFDTLAIYRSMEHLPLEVYNLSMTELNHEKLDIEHTLRVNRYLMNFYVVALLITFPLFLYYSVPAFYNKNLFTYEYLNTGFIYGFCFFMALTSYIMDITEQKFTQTAIEIVSCFIDKSE